MYYRLINGRYIKKYYHYMKEILEDGTPKKLEDQSKGYNHIITPKFIFIAL